MPENYNLKIKNYHLNHNQTVLIKDKIEFLLRQCPSNSLISLHCDYTKGFFEGHLSVTSVRKNFYSAAREKTFELFTKDLYRKTQKQVYRWKKARTYEEITGIIHLENYRSADDSTQQKKNPSEKKIAV